MPPRKSKKKTPKKGAKKKRTRPREIRTGLFGMRKKIAPSRWIPEETIYEIWSAPRGTGHIDRFFFTNCTGDHQVEYLTAAVYQAGANEPTYPAPEYTAPIPPMENGEVPVPGEPIQCLWIDIVAQVSGPAGNVQYTYHCEIPMQQGEYIHYVVVGLAGCPEGDELVSPFGLIVGHLGTRFPLQSADVESSPI